jgi:monothiol glutaredoxin
MSSFFCLLPTTMHAITRAVLRSSVSFTTLHSQLKIPILSQCSRLQAPRLLPRRFLSQDARTKIQSAIDAKPVVLFMKGDRELPQCGFSRAVVQVLDVEGVPPEKISTYNVLDDAELRSGIKEFSLACAYSESLNLGD